SDVSSGQIAPSKHNSRAVNGSLQRVVGLTETWPSRCVYTIGAHCLEPGFPVGCLGIECHGIVVQQHVMAKIIRALQSMFACEEPRAAHRCHGLVEEHLRHESRILTVSEANCCVESVAPKVNELEARRHPHVDVRVQFAETLQSGEKPFDGEYRGHADRQCSSRVTF